jgi:hypothetical protein
MILDTNPSMIEKYVFALLVLEILEIAWQKGESFKPYLANLFQVYDKNVLLFFSLHPTIYFVTILSLYLDTFNLLTISIFSCKLLDILFKISLLHKIKNEEELGMFAHYIEQDLPIPKALKYFGVILYPTLLFFALSPQ